MAQHTVWLSPAVGKQWLWSQLVVFPDKQYSSQEILVYVVFDRELIHSLLTNLNNCANCYLGNNS